MSLLSTPDDVSTSATLPLQTTNSSTRVYEEIRQRGEKRSLEFSAWLDAEKEKNIAVDKELEIKNKQYRLEMKTATDIIAQTMKNYQHIVDAQDAEIKTLKEQLAREMDQNKIYLQFYLDNKSRACNVDDTSSREKA